MVGRFQTGKIDIFFPEILTRTTVDLKEKRVLFPISFIFKSMEYTDDC